VEQLHTLISEVAQIMAALYLPGITFRLSFNPLPAAAFHKNQH
jgi:hypothetical protein